MFKSLLNFIKKKRCRTKMGKKYWNSKARNYDSEIFSSIDYDKNQIITTTIKEFADKKLSAADFGCGIGKYLPLLTDCFNEVYAIDYAVELLDVARELCNEKNNLHFINQSLSDDHLSVPHVDVIICINVLISPNEDERTKILTNIYDKLHPGGICILLTPSQESFLYGYLRFQQVSKKHNIPLNEIETFSKQCSQENLLRGVYHFGEVATKHYLHEELTYFLEQHHFIIKKSEKVTYTWEDAYYAIPVNMGEPTPWDWLFVIEKPLKL